MKIIIKEIHDSSISEFIKKYKIDREIYLDYSDVEVPDTYVPPSTKEYASDPGYWKTYSVDIEYPVDTERVIDLFYDDILEKYPDEIQKEIERLNEEKKYEEADDVFYKYLSEHFDKLIYDDKEFFNHLLDFFEDDAEEWAWDHYE